MVISRRRKGREHAEEIRASTKRENDAYYTIDTAADLEREWPRVLAGHPDFIKVFLLHSEKYEARKQSAGEGKASIQNCCLLLSRALTPPTFASAPTWTPPPTTAPP